MNRADRDSTKYMIAGTRTDEFEQAFRTGLMPAHRSDDARSC
jgi:hypothetical protein